MKLIKKELKKVTHLFFMDIEGTQRQHEVIEVGGVLVSVNAQLEIIKDKPPVTFRSYALAYESVGSIVTSLTGITDTKLKEAGTTFEACMRRLNKLIGNLGENLSIIVFGNQDPLMLGNSLKVLKEENPFLTSFIPYLQKHMFDFSEFISHYVRGEKNQPYSLLHLLEIFSIISVGQAHDPVVDAMNLMNLYDKVTHSAPMLAELYKSNMLASSSLMSGIDPILRKSLERLLRGSSVSAKEFTNDFVRYFE